MVATLWLTISLHLRRQMFRDYQNIIDKKKITQIPNYFYTNSNPNLNTSANSSFVSSYRHKVEYLILNLPVIVFSEASNFLFLSLIYR